MGAIGLTSPGSMIQQCLAKQVLINFCNHYHQYEKQEAPICSAYILFFLNGQVSSSALQKEEIHVHKWLPFA